MISLFRFVILFSIVTSVFARTLTQRADDKFKDTKIESKDIKISHNDIQLHGSDDFISCRGMDYFDL